jgi:acrylyl-CoA reductase (NADPH)
MNTNPIEPLTFEALEVFQNDDTQGFESRLVQKSLKDLPTYELSEPSLTVQVHYSSLNYKDALSAAGNKGVTRHYPHTPGIDAAGVVTHSEDPRFAVGDAVIVTSYDLGMNTSGGLAEYIRVPAAWAVPLPEGMSLADSMSWGTAGLTAAMAIAKMQAVGQTPAQGPVVVTGASGGVGSLAVLLLADLGYTVWAVSGKSDYHEMLLSLGAARCLSREDVDDQSGKPLLRPRWAGAIDTVGGNTLSTLIKACDKEGAIAVCGLVRSAVFETTVYPWILNGIHLLGIDSATYPAALRSERWQALAKRTPALQAQLQKLTHELSLAEVPGVLSDMLAGKSRGRYRVQLFS